MILGFLAGCAGDTRWEIVFEASADRDRTVGIDALVLEGGCDGARTVAAFDLRPSGGDASENLAPPPGDYGLVAVARDDACMEVAHGCEEIELPGESAITVVLEPTTEPTYACAGRVCEGGACARGPGLVACSPNGTRAALAAGAGHACALSTSCGLFCWGDGTAIPGARTGEDVLSPIALVPSARSREIAAGGTHTCVLRDDGVVLCAGSGDDGQLGRGDTADRTELGAIASDQRFTTIAAGDAHTCGITQAGALSCWGSGGPWLGRSGSSDALEPMNVTASTRFTSVTAGARHTCAIDEAGQLWCFGDNGAGQLGLGDLPSADVPTVLPGECWASVTAGRAHTAAITCGGELHRWGGTDRTPARADDASDWRLVAAGGDETCGVRADGTLWCSPQGAVPLQITASNGWVSVAVGDGFTCARDVRSSVFCWGENDRGQLGAGDTATREAPSPVR